MNILDFLLHNFFIVLAVIAGIVSFFKGSLSSEKQEKETKRAQKPFVPQQTSPMRKRVEQEIKKRQRSTESLEEKLKEAKQQVENEIAVPPLVPRVHVKKEKVEAPAPSLHVSKKQVVQGVIWSEILGPPRSKNPYHSRTQR